VTPERVAVYRVHPDAVLPQYGTTASAGFDLATCEPVSISPGEIRLVRTGLVLAYSDHLYLQLCNRSSTPKKWGLELANGVGVVDPDYCGPADEIRLLYRNITASEVFVPANTRLAQGVLTPRFQAWFQEITAEEAQRNASRGGFGSTGCR
jgi:dUTP pyrophosphatase